VVSATVARISAGQVVKKRSSQTLLVAVARREATALDIQRAGLLLDSWT
jgi:hypothetical protein